MAKLKSINAFYEDLSTKADDISAAMQALPAKLQDRLRELWWLSILKR